MISNQNNSRIVLDIIDQIHINAAYLSEIDGLSGDGDHGINMDKGFQLAKTRIDSEMSFSEALIILGRTLVMDIGGSMGPIYGTFFNKLGKSFTGKAEITVLDLRDGLNDSLSSLMELAGAKPNDKTLIDTLMPAIEEMSSRIDLELTDKDVLEGLKEGAYRGKENTKKMVAKIGRAARLGERSLGLLDAGATSCWVIIDSLANSIIEML